MEKWIRLTENKDTRSNSQDLNVQVAKGEGINIQTNLFDERGVPTNLIFTLEEIEALHSFAQLVKANL